MDPEPDNMEAMMDEPMEDQEMMMNEEMMEKMSQKTSKTVEEQIKHQDHEFCCCCVCQCQTEVTRNLACCGCFPIKCGVITIGVITFVLLILLFVEVFYCLLNEYDDWWYVLVGLVLLIPHIVACCFFIVFFASETDTTRSTLKVGCMLVIISVTLLAVWNTVYFHYLYKYPDVYTGSPDTGYLKQTKKQYIVWSLVLAAAIDAVYAYFLCVCQTYKNALNKPDEEEKMEEEPKKEEMMMKEEPKEEEKKDDMMMEEPKDEAMDMMEGAE